MKKQRKRPEARWNVYLPPELDREVDALAVKRLTSKSSLIRQVMAKEVSAAKKEAA